MENSISGKNEKELRHFIDDYKHFSLVRNFHLADFITLANGLCGSYSIFSCIQYMITKEEWSLWLGILLMPLGMLFDLLDGKVARWRKCSSLLGQELDSLADLISFGVAPAVCGFVVGMRTFADTIILSIFITCGIARLARYNASVASLPKDSSGKISYYEGTPIPTTLSIVAVIAYLFKVGQIDDNLPGGSVELSPNIQLHPVVLLYALSGIAMVSKTLKIPKI
ncbi:CDP-diacylglycerol--serine O-phosphatidyltransferase [Gigaspora margarita]|uniref:CDP-diacylglycerol--serine O-phosphatidyltransferase n=1 Tax=Gigaspora margarita TaxID=4874 RepID=A0A8H4EVP6_GIGMA|nr:CDP-diacylglycerol--serine O-phosphatidyltransferase [Gigaspora margarita]